MLQHRFPAPRLAFAAGVALALGFGARAAAAAPAAPHESRPACFDIDCKKACQSLGYSGGVCIDDACRCLF
ncbi:MAG TPA: hypothetical protein VF771_20100 [Longimicrobiaceae bacterium]